MTPFTYDYPRPNLTVDIVVLRGEGTRREVLLVRRGLEPFAGRWALPGGFVNEDEPLEKAARRELAEETGLVPTSKFVQFGAYGDPGRDPRGWTVAVAFLVKLSNLGPHVRGGDDAADAAWHKVAAHPRLAFDHDLILQAAMEHAG
jgi:8-oxo-dGTP diphosphatase